MIWGDWVLLVVLVEYLRTILLNLIQIASGVGSDFHHNDVSILFKDRNLRSTYPCVTHDDSPHGQSTASNQ